MVAFFKQLIAKLRNRQNILRTAARIPLLFEVDSRLIHYEPKSQISSARVNYEHLRAPKKLQLHITKEENIEFESNFFGIRAEERN